METGLPGAKEASYRLLGLQALVQENGVILKRGETSRDIRPGIDPVQLYVSIAGLCYFYLSNVYTLSVAFGRELLSAPAMKERIDHVVDFVLAGVRA